MKIGIDIDDTIANTSELVLKYLSDNNEQIEFNDFKNYMSEIIRGIYRNKEILFLLFKYGEVVAKEAAVKEDVAEVIKFLKEKGYEIYIITSRTEKNIKGIKEITENYFKENNIMYDKLLTGRNDKKNICIEEGIDFLIDDSVDTINELESPTKGILFNSIINSDKKTNATRVNNWIEIREYFENI